MTHGKRLFHIVAIVVSLVYVISAENWDIRNDKKAELENWRINNLNSLSGDERSDIIAEGKPLKSPPRAVILSAVLPGSGEAYAGSWKKAALFFAAEVAGWTININYNNRGDDEDSRMKKYANTHWSEQKYWTYVYWKSAGIEGWADLGVDPDQLDAEHLLPQQIIDENIEILRQIEEANPHFSHSLPETKTQQYYEMIGKYALQFGHGWDDATDFNQELSGYDGGVITENNEYYMDMRKYMEDLYAVASKAAQMLLLNHVISAIDAGWTAKINNSKVEISLDGKIKVIREEMTEFVGFNISF